MIFKIKNPNYSREALEQIAVAVIIHQTSTGFDTITSCRESEGMSKREEAQKHSSQIA